MEEPVEALSEEVTEAKDALDAFTASITESAAEEVTVDMAEEEIVSEAKIEEPAAEPPVEEAPVAVEEAPVVEEAPPAEPEPPTEDAPPAETPKKVAPRVPLGEAAYRASIGEV